MNSKIKITPVRRTLSKKEKREAEKQRKHLEGSPILFLLYLGGLISMLFVFVESELLSFGYFLIASVFISVLSTALWYVYFYQSKYFVYVVIGFCVLAMLLGAWQIPQMARMFSGIFWGRDYNFSFAMIALFVVAAVFILFALEFVLRRHEALFILAGAEVIAGPLIELKASFVTIILIILFQFAFFVLNMTKARQKREFVSKNRASVSNSAAVIIAILLLISFIPAIIVQKLYEEELFLGVYQTDAVINDIVDKLTGNYGGTEIDGSVSRGNLRQTGQSAFDLKTKKLPEDRMYFRRFTGMSYLGDYWEENFWFHEKPTDHYGLDSMEKYLSSSTYYYGSENDEDEEYEEYEEQDIEYMYTDQLDYDILNEVTQYYKNKVYDFVMLFLQNIPDDMTFRITGLGNTVDVLVYDKDNDLVMTVWMNTVSTLFLGSDTDGEMGEDHIDGNFMQVAMIINDEKKYDSYDPYSDYSESFYFPPSKDALEKAEKYFRKEPTLSDYIQFEDYDYSIEEGTGRYYFYDLDKNPDLKEIVNYPSIFTTNESSDYADNIIYSLRDNDDNVNHIKITPAQYSWVPTVPYYCEATQGDIMSNRSNYYGTNDNSYQNAFIVQTDITAKDKWDDNPIYHYAMKRISEDAGNYYSYTNPEALPRLTELCRGKDFDGDLNTVTTFILYTLQNNAKYDANPGTTPWNKDPAEYFLFDNHKGFCVHYATVAANMYRMLGIPARYVAGYVVDPLFMHETGRNESYYKYQINVTDYSAHAWVEIFLKDYGWVPVEVTPDKNNEMHARYPGYDEEVMNRIMREHGWFFSEGSGSGGAGDAGGAGGFGDLGNLSGAGAVYLLILIPAAALVFLAALLIRRAVVISRAPKESCTKAFDRIIRALHCAGLLTDMNGSEPDFACALSGCLECIPPDRGKQILEIMQRHCFSQTCADEAETEQIRSARADITRELYDKLPLRRKLIFKYREALI